ncbi:hypothetical protein C4566_01230 [Candidatus Parcubacteria bacterium]|nr:MAG: hypothetical protein C4566_01230 [Candidatus Parcubacteria bacterium]
MEIRQEQGLAVEAEVLGPQSLDDALDLERVGAADADERTERQVRVAGDALAIDDGHDRVCSQTELIDGLDGQLENADVQLPPVEPEEH